MFYISGIAIKKAIKYLRKSKIFSDIYCGIGGGLTNGEFYAFVNDIALALDKNGVKQPAKNEVLGFANSLRDQIVEKL